MAEKLDPKASQQQPFDSSFKALLDDQTKAMLAFLFEEEIEEAKELKEGVLKEGNQPSLRVDCAYRIKSHGQEEEYVGHVEFETSPAKKEIEARLLEYFGGLYRRYKQPIIQVLVCPFETKNLPTPPLAVTFRGKSILWLDYRVICFWELEAQELVNKGQVKVYAVLPTMKGATAELLVQAIDAMKALYAEEPDRLGIHLLCFWTFLHRSKTVTQEDKERIDKKMDEFGSLLDDNPFVERRKAEAEEKGRREGRQEGLVEGLVEGEAKGLQESVVTIVEVRFPPLTELAQQRIAQIDKPDALRLLLKGVVSAPDEATARWVLDTLAA